jgi:ABC-type Mn2+/Zn2+ transport system ATPase subunit
MLTDVKKKRKMTILLITHDIHIVKEYSEYLLALNKCVTFFGKSEEIANLATQRAIYGEPVCIGSLKAEE